MASIFLLILTGLIFAVVWMIAAWIVYLFCKNPAIVDLAWTLCVFGISCLYFYYSGAKSLVSFIVLFSMILWVFRLGSLLIYRLITRKIDGRYETLSAKWKKNLEIRYFIFFIFQGFAAAILTLPFAFIMQSDSPFIWYDVLATLFVFTGFIGLVFADLQLQSFIRKSKNIGKVCKSGLWRYTRHPNYFFEWIFWMGQFLFAIHFPWGFLSIISPLGLLYILLYVTGIPAAEEQSLLSKKQAYKDYQKETSSFIPWWPKVCRKK
jgi:steroid 5-alpha reductase family enzyme